MKLVREQIPETRRRTSENVYMVDVRFTELRGEKPFFLPWTVLNLNFQLGLNYRYRHHSYLTLILLLPETGPVGKLLTIMFTTMLLEVQCHKHNFPVMMYRNKVLRDINSLYTLHQALMIVQDCWQECEESEYFYHPLRSYDSSFFFCATDSCRDLS